MNSQPASVPTLASAVVDASLCSGCGGCTLLDSRLVMVTAGDGFARPELGEGPGPAPRHARLQAARFERTCPGRQVAASSPAPEQHPLFGSAESVWEAHATDSNVRFVGSSGGTLTAIASWLISTGRAARVAGVAADAADPTKSVPTTMSTPYEVLQAAGSRYAPSPTLANPDVLREGTAVVAKPCEAHALRELSAGQPSEAVVLSFFCAGVPSQLATSALVESFGVDSARVTSMRYRGHGWPGGFSVTDADGNHGESPYAESWGQHLGPTTQWRCKLCPDGVGERADIAAGDYWETDSRGYPVFADSAGRSVLIARTPLGHELIQQAVADGVLDANPLELEALVPVQPLQTERRTVLFGRALGVRLAGGSVPRYRGFRLVRFAIAHPMRNLRAARGAYVRARRLSS